MELLKMQHFAINGLNYNGIRIKQEKLKNKKIVFTKKISGLIQFTVTYFQLRALSSEGHQKHFLNFINEATVAIKDAITNIRKKGEIGYKYTLTTIYMLIYYMLACELHSIRLIYPLIMGATRNQKVINSSFSLNKAFSLLLMSVMLVFFRSLPNYCRTHVSLSWLKY